LPWWHIQILGPGRAEPLVEAAGEDEEPVGSDKGGLGEEVSESGGPLRPLLPASEISECVSGFPERRDNRRDLVERVVAWPLKKLRPACATGVEHAVPVAGDLHDDLCDGWIVAAERMVSLCALATAAAEQAFVAAAMLR
jgi:hypothetical protein